MRVLSTAVRFARWMAYVGLGFGVLYSFGRLLMDSSTTGLNGETASAFLALIGMPAIFAACGFLGGALFALAFGTIHSPVDRAEPGPRQHPEPDVQLVRVFTAGDPGVIAVAKSLLEAEEIDCLIRGDNIQDLFGVGRLGAQFNNVVGPTEFWVRSDEAERARAILEELDTPTEPHEH